MTDQQPGVTHNKMYMWNVTQEWCGKTRKQRKEYGWEDGIRYAHSKECFLRWKCETACWCCGSGRTTQLQILNSLCVCLLIETISYYWAVCCSEVEPASCYRKVTGLFPLVCMLKCPWARYWTRNCSWCAGPHLAWQPPPSVYKCMNYCKTLWTKASAKCPKL